MASGRYPCAASSLLGGVLDGAPLRLTEVTRTRVSVHYETPSPAVPVLCVGTPAAVRLPASLVAQQLPASGPAQVGDGVLVAAGETWHPTRWWRPPRPGGLPRPALTAAELADLLTGEVTPLVWGFARPGATYDGLVPADLLGAGPGLTPAGDDVLAGALVAAHATADPRLPRWARQTRALLTRARTTAVSRAMLHHALDGYASPELARFVSAVCRVHDVEEARAGLLDVGHTSGAALMVGVLHTLSTYQLEGAP